MIYSKPLIKQNKIDENTFNFQNFAPIMINFFKKLALYPPAETYIPLPAILDTFLHPSGNFEKVLCNYLRVEQCVLACSGRALLYLLLETLKKKDEGIRNEVLIPGYTCYSVAASVAKAGLKLKVYDIDPKTLQPDFDSLRNSTSTKTLAIICQHLFGIPTPVDEFEEIAQKAGVPLIEDAAQAMGGSIDGHSLDTIGDFSIFSFGRGKPLPLGGGGALVGKDEDVLSEIKFKQQKQGYAQIVATAAAQLLSSPLFYWIPEILPLGLGETIFDPNFKVSAMHPVMQNLAENSMDILNDLNTHRRHIAKTYVDAFDHKNIFLVSEETTPIYTRFPLMAGLRQIPKELKRLGVRRMYPKAIADEETIKPYLVEQEVSTPGASEIAQNLITLPTHLRVGEKLAIDIANMTKKSFLTC